MKTLEQLAREAGMERDGDGWFTPSGDPAGEYDVSTADLARFRAACRAEALEEAAPVLSRAAEMLTAYAELVKATGKYAEMHYVPEIEYHAAAIRELK